MATRTYTLAPGEGLRIDFTDIWTLRSIIDDGATAILMDPRGQTITLQRDRWHRPAPGFRLSLAPSSTSERIHLIADCYIPRIFRHPPRDTRTPRLPEQG